jgi:hypothetical protein
MSWASLVLAVIPLATAWLALRRSGADRLIAIVAMLASAACVALAVARPAAELLPPAVRLALFAVALIAVMAVAAGRLRHVAQWLSVAAGALAIAAFFVLYAQTLFVIDRLLAGEDVEEAVIRQDILAALLPVGGVLILGVPGLIAKIQEARAQPGGPGAAWPRWRPSQWLALAVGAAIAVGGVALVYMRAVGETGAVIIVVGGILVAALGPRLLGMLTRPRRPAAPP